MSENTPEGATPEEPIIDPEANEPAADEPIEGEDALGDPGKKALDTMKQKLRDAEKKEREARAELAKRDTADALRDKPAEEQAIEKARAEARAEATKAADVRIVKTELRLAAKGVLADPADAIAFINLDDFTVGDDGEVDSDALNDAITELIERKPHLAAGKPARFEGGADQGASNKAAKLGQLSEADLENMTHEAINEARRQGRFNKVLGIN